MLDCTVQYQYLLVLGTPPTTQHHLPVVLCATLSALFSTQLKEWTRHFQKKYEKSGLRKAELVKVKIIILSPVSDEYHAERHSELHG